MTSGLCNASCSYERMATSNADAEDLKQPLIIIQDLESSSSSQEEPNTDIARQRVSIRVLVKSFCFGAFAGLLLRAVSFSAFCVMFKKWGKNTQPDESAPLFLYLLFYADIAFHTLIWVGHLMTITRKGSMYMRKKFDNDAHAPKSESVWNVRFLFLSVMGFRFGFISGSYGAWAIFDITMGMPVSLVPLLCSFLVDMGLCCLMIKCFDWAHDPSIADDKPEEDSFFI